MAVWQGSDESKLRKALNMWRRRLLYQCFTSWVSVAAGFMKLRRKAAMRIANALLTRAFNAWLEQVGSLLQVEVSDGTP